MADDTDSEHRKYYKRERRYGSFQRSIALPRSASVNDIDCTYEKGSLKLIIPKNSDDSGQKIEVKIK